MTTKASKPKDETIEEKYQKMSQHEHVLKIPDTYIGSISPDQADLWVVNDKNKMERKSITFVPG
jgi:DNA topoisomerase-2